jgi:hypothetical protein
MIKNGFNSYGSKALEGVDGGDSGVTVLRAGPAPLVRFVPIGNIRGLA